MNYTSANYAGPAIKLAAGIQVEEAYEAAHQRAALVVGGDCATVGVVGGYLQGVSCPSHRKDDADVHTIQAEATPRCPRSTASQPTTRSNGKSWTAPANSTPPPPSAMPTSSGPSPVAAAGRTE